MQKKRLIAAIVLAIFGFLIFFDLSDNDIASSLNTTFYYIFLFIFILIVAVLGIGIFASILIFALPFVLLGGFIFLLVIGEYFFAFVWFITGAFIISFLSGDLTRKKNEIKVIAKYYGCSMAKAEEYHKRLNTKEIKVIEEALKKGRRYKWVMTSPK